MSEMILKIVVGHRHITVKTQSLVITETNQPIKHANEAITCISASNKGGSE